jgi:hypothetical protein
MNWERNLAKNFLFALLGGIAANAVYLGLLYTNLHGFAVKALGTAFELLYFHIDPNCNAPIRCYVEEFVVNILLYTFWIFVALTAIELLRQVKRRFAS